MTRPGGHAWIVASNADHGRVLHTADYGKTWRVDTLPLTTRSGSGPQSIAFRDAQNGMALGGGNAAKPGDVLIATTNDGGKTWIARTSPALRYRHLGWRVRAGRVEADGRRGRASRRRVFHR